MITAAEVKQLHGLKYSPTLPLFRAIFTPIFKQLRFTVLVELSQEQKKQKFTTFHCIAS